MAFGYIKMRSTNQIRVLGQLGFFYYSFGTYRRPLYRRSQLERDEDYLVCKIKGLSIVWETHSSCGLYTSSYDPISFDDVFELLTPEQQEIAVWNLDLLK